MICNRLFASSIILAVLFFLGCTVPAAAQPAIEYTLAPLSIPAEYGSILPMDITNSGEVLGWSRDTSNFGVVLSPRGGSRFAIPGSVFMVPVGMAANGTILGTYSGEDGNIIMFTRTRHGTVTPLSVQGEWYFADPWDISDSGIAVGVLSASPDGPSYAFMQDRGRTQIITVPGATQTYLTAVNNARTAIGFWDGPDGGGTFIRDSAGRMTPLVIGEADSIFPLSINNVGTVAGMYSDGITWHGFVYRDGAVTTIDFVPPTTVEHVDPDSGATLTLTLISFSTEVDGINDAGRIVGSALGHYGNDEGTVFSERLFPFIGRPAK